MALDPQAPPPTDTAAPAAAAAPQPPKFTLEQYAEMERKARLNHDWKAVDYFQAKQAELSPGTKENRAIQPRAEADFGRLSPENILGGAVEPNLAMLTGVAQPLAGYMGLGKLGWNALSRMAGGSPAPATDTVARVQGFQYQPKTEGGQQLPGAMSAPFDWWKEHVAERAGRNVEEGLTGLHAGPEISGFGGAMADATMDAAPQLLAMLFGAKAGEAPLPGRQAAADLAGRVGLDAVKNTIGRAPRNPDIDLLLKKGITPTIGQRASMSPNPLTRFFKGRGEEWWTRHPLLGANIIAARERAVQEHAWAQLNDARTPVGLPKIEPGKMTWHDAIKDTEAKLKLQYNNLLGRTNGLPNAWSPGQGFPVSFSSELTGVLNDAKVGHPGTDYRPLRTVQYKRLEAITRDIHAHFRDVRPKSMKPGMTRYDQEITGESLKKIQTLLRDEKELANASRDPAYKDMVPYIKRLQDAYQKMIERSNPGAATELKNLDMAYSQLKIVMDAATHGGAASKAGFFSPAQTLRSVEKRARRRLGQSEGDAMLARGEAQGQPLAEAAQRVLGNRVPNSGTPEALIAAAELSGDISTGLGDISSSGLAKFGAGALTDIVGMPILYSKGVQDWLARSGQSRTGTGIGPAMTALSPASMTAAQRGRQDMDEQMQEELKQLGVNPDMMR